MKLLREKDIGSKRRTKADEHSAFAEADDKPRNRYLVAIKKISAKNLFSEAGENEQYEIDKSGLF